MDSRPVLNRSTCQNFSPNLSNLFNSCMVMKVSDEYRNPQVGNNSQVVTNVVNCQQMNQRNRGRLNQLNKQNVFKYLNELYNNPDFQYSASMIKDGTTGIKEYLSEQVMQGGNGEPFNSNSSLLNVTTRLVGTVSDAIKTASSLSTEHFIDYYQNPQVVPYQLMKFGEVNGCLLDQCKILLNQLGDLTVGDILNMLLSVMGNKDVDKTVNNVMQAGGMVYQLVSVPIYDEKVYFDLVMNLFNKLQETINSAIDATKQQLANNRAPAKLQFDLVQIQKGLNICLQMIRYYLLVDKKKNN